MAELCHRQKSTQHSADSPGSPGPCPLPAGTPWSLSLLCAATEPRAAVLLLWLHSGKAFREWEHHCSTSPLYPAKPRGLRAVLHERKFGVSALHYVGVMCWALPGNFHRFPPKAAVKPGLFCCFLCLWAYRNCMLAKTWVHMLWRKGSRFWAFLTGWFLISLLLKLLQNSCFGVVWLNLLFSGDFC